MRLRVFKIKAVLALLLVLCLGAPLLLSAATAASVAEHTHVCSDEGHKGECVDVRECCKICLYFYNVKNRMSSFFGNTVNAPSAVPGLPSQYVVTEFLSFDVAFSTLVCLNVRLNN